MIEFHVAILLGSSVLFGLPSCDLVAYHLDRGGCFLDTLFHSPAERRDISEGANARADSACGIHVRIRDKV